jgi:putative aminopeptidase FrvX
MVMLPKAAYQRLEHLLSVSAPSGYEGDAGSVWRDIVQDIAVVQSDAVGNSYGIVAHPVPDFTILLTAHVDEIGLIVHYIDEDGYVFFKSIGGWDPATFVGQRVVVHGRQGPVHGVIGRVATHLMDDDEQKQPIKVEDLWIDLGTENVNQTNALVRIGDFGVLDVDLITLTDDVVVSRGIDNRVGAFIVAEVLRRVAEPPGRGCVIGAATTREEIGPLTGAFTAANSILRPDFAVVIDMTHAVDTPSVRVERWGERHMRSGPVLCRGGYMSEKVFEVLEQKANENHIPFTIEATPERSYTDADCVFAANGGIPLNLVGCPIRYMHTPNEMISLSDIENTIRLLTAVCRG